MAQSKPPAWLTQMPRALTAGREMMAVARFSWLLRHDVIAPVLPQRAQAGEDVVVCLHGLFATAGVLRPLRQRLEGHGGVHTATMSYGVGPGIETLARRLGELCAALPSSVAIHLLGHSVGGIVARWFAQKIGDPRVVQTISMAAPFAGIGAARWLGVAIARDLHPASTLLRELRLGAHRQQAVPHLSIIADSDHILGAPTSHALPGGDVVVLPQCSHNALLYRDEVAGLIEQRIIERRHSR